MHTTVKIFGEVSHIRLNQVSNSHGLGLWETNSHPTTKMIEHHPQTQKIQQHLTKLLPRNKLPTWTPTTPPMLFWKRCVCFFCCCSRCFLFHETNKKYPALQQHHLFPIALPSALAGVASTCWVKWSSLTSLFQRCGNSSRSGHRLSKLDGLAAI